MKYRGVLLQCMFLATLRQAMPRLRRRAWKNYNPVRRLCCATTYLFECTTLFVSTSTRTTAVSAMSSRCIAYVTMSICRGNAMQRPYAAGVAPCNTESPASRKSPARCVA